MGLTAAYGEHDEQYRIHQEVFLEGKSIREPCGQRYDHDLCNEIRRWDPGNLIGACTERPCDVAQRGVGDDDIEDRDKTSKEYACNANPGLQCHAIRN